MDAIQDTVFKCQRINIPFTHTVISSRIRATIGDIVQL